MRGGGRGDEGEIEEEEEGEIEIEEENGRWGVKARDRGRVVWGWEERAGRELV